MARTNKPALTAKKSPAGRSPGSVVMSSSKCDFSLMSDGVSLQHEGIGSATDLNFKDRIGNLQSSSSKCDWTILAADSLDRFTVRAKAMSSKCDFSLVVDFGIRGGASYRAIGGGGGRGVGAAGGPNKCDFFISMLDEVSNPSPERR